MTKFTFDLIKLRAEVAMQQVLVEHGHQPRVYGRECPFCQSTDFVKSSLEKGRQRYRCRSCQRRFNERPVFECDCLVVGQALKCQDCPQFQSIMQAAKQRIKELADWSVEQLQVVLQQPVNRNDLFQLELVVPSLFETISARFPHKCGFSEYY